MITIKSSISLTVDSRRSATSINFDFLSDLQNLSELVIFGYSDGENINKMLSVLAARNTVRMLYIFSATCTISPLITPQTINQFLQWIALSNSRIDRVVAHSLFSAYIKTILFHTAELGCNSANDSWCFVPISKAKVIELLGFLPKSGTFTFMKEMYVSFEVTDLTTDNWNQYI